MLPYARHFFVRDMVESFEIEVPFVPTDENPADFFTKPMKDASKFNYFRSLVMNVARSGPSVEATSVRGGAFAGGQRE